jgi:hypothetical protein
MEHNCPYCNEEIPPAAMAEPWFASPCCQKVVMCRDFSELEYALRPATDNEMVKLEISGFTNTDPDALHTHKRKTEPRWAHVYSNGAHWFVRIIPPTDLQEHGRGHGVSLGNKYTTKAEANKFADSMESYFGDAEKQLVEESKDASL